MITEAVLPEDRIVEIARSLCWQTRYSEIKDNAVELARAIEQAVLQSPEIQRAIRDAERYRWLRSDENRFEGEAWLCNLAPESLDAAIDAAMEGTA